MSRCKGCDADVLWVITEAGNAMPLDPDPVADGNIVKTGRVRANSGGRTAPEVRYHIQDALFDDDAPRYVSHFATCIMASEFRR